MKTFQGFTHPDDFAPVRTRITYFDGGKITVSLWSGRKSLGKGEMLLDELGGFMSGMQATLTMPGYNDHGVELWRDDTDMIVSAVDGSGVSVKMLVIEFNGGIEICRTEVIRQLLATPR